MTTPEKIGFVFGTFIGLAFMAATMALFPPVLKFVFWSWTNPWNWAFSGFGMLFLLIVHTKRKLSH